MRMIPAALLAPAGLAAALAADLKAASQLSHPNLVKVIGFVEWKGERCLVTEHVPGRNFAEALASGRRLGFQQVHALGRVVAQVLGGRPREGPGARVGAALERHGRLRGHQAGRPRPGPARTAGPGDPVVPRARGRPSTRPTTSTPSAAVLYHLLTGTHPLSLPQGAGLPLPSQLAPGVPEAMDKLLLRGLHPRPELRLGSASDLLAELREMVKIG